ncbi:AbrB family transcriptional regulator [Neorhizobium lilium]|uniref:AbrB family transcriptional regulator n=2 Tax=Neorhizobium lilium TaxID=2503024 RepID=A0A3S3RF88_9HYPH|nr:AbrB family transcriptional regulator [Neorhizobium lilium]
MALEWLHLPAALLLGPMAIAVILAVTGGGVGTPRWGFVIAQGVVGLMISTSLPPTIFGEIAEQWPIFVAGVLSTAIAAAALGWLMARAQIFPGTTAIWGSSPGAASVMTLMSESYGGDMRLVAFMQYIRVVCCALVATVVARVMGVTPADAALEIVWFPDVSWPAVLATAAIAAGVSLLGAKLRIPGGPMLLPLAVGMVLNLSGLMPIVLPPWLLAISYAVIGWGIGMRFTPDVIAHAASTFPRVLMSVLSLIAICGVFAMVLVAVTGMDPLSAYLATSPGGADSVAIIAASTKVDVPFVMTMQIARFLFVVITGPATARLLSRAAR